MYKYTALNEPNCRSIVLRRILIAACRAETAVFNKSGPGMTGKNSRQKAYLCRHYAVKLLLK